ncbi:MAG: hypothetical protein ACREON_11420 [Gemmatimonadaceae bacterium]
MRHMLGCFALLLTVAAPRPALAQMLGVPVVQSPFAGSGFTVAANFGTTDGANTYGLAASWAPANGRFLLSGGAGALDPDAGDAAVTWGMRAMVPVMGVRGGSVGVAAFGGLGGASESGVTELRVPVGVTAGYRRALGASRGAAVYVTPFYSWARLSGNEGDARSAGVFRVSLGIDVAVLPSLGVTLGYETGDEASAGDPGPVGGVFGVGLSYALQRNR